jgi:arylsulfatase A-like enzyme
MPPTRRDFLARTGLAGAALMLGRAAAQPARRPNLLVIHTDEHSIRTLGCYRALLPPEQAFVWGPGVAVETPHIDWLARHGAVCERFYATSPVCTPSRAAFVSGRYPQNTGALVNDRPLRDEVVTFAEVLRRAGYATGYAGKWHLDGPARPGWAPARRFGFSDNRYLFNRGHWKQLAEDDRGPRVGATNAQGQPTYAVVGANDKSFTTDFLADRAVRFIQEHRDQPFCYMVSLPDPHGPNTVRAPYDTMFDKLPFQQPRTAKEKGTDLPGYAATQPDRFNVAQMARYFGMVKCIDDNVGKILAALRAAGVLEQTYVVFTSDHGDMCGEHGRHNKSIPADGSARVPFVLYAPGAVQPGTVVRPALGGVDFKPTILALLGVASTNDEGRDFSPLLRGRDAPWRDAPWQDVSFLRIGGDNAGWLAACTQRHKLIVSPVDDPSLFDVERDPDELTNLWRRPEARETVRTLGRELRRYVTQHKDPHGASPAVQADLAWACEGTGAYVAPRRPKRAVGAEEE